MTRNAIFIWIRSVITEIYRSASSSDSTAVKAREDEEEVLALQCCFKNIAAYQVMRAETY